MCHNGIKTQDITHFSDIKRSGQNANALNFKAGDKKWQILISGCYAVKLTGYKIAKCFFLPLQQ
jgi:hypothetical protein